MVVAVFCLGTIDDFRFERKKKTHLLVQILLLPSRVPLSLPKHAGMDETWSRGLSWKKTFGRQRFVMKI